ncbi:MAG: response regulator transcription factor [Verrucomicrobiota bacterium]|nr:response regulator transcription factor [Verrucomicrobiota bacterium]
MLLLLRASPYSLLNHVFSHFSGHAWQGRTKPSGGSSWIGEFFRQAGGGDGYLLKDNEPRDIVAAIRTVLSGGMMFDPIVARAVDRELKNVLPNPPTNPLGELSEQERRVLAAVADGKTDKEIAVALGLQPKTVRNYLERVFEKLGVNSRTQAAVLFDRHRRS